MPLVGLDEIDWNKLTHAYGTAENIPNLLRAIDTAGSYHDFEEAMRDLWTYIYHQGDVYEATPISLHFVFQILKNSDDTERKILILMGIAETIRYADLPTEYAVAKELDYLLLLLEDEILELRAGSIFVLSFLPKNHERILPALAWLANNTSNELLAASAIWTYGQILKANSPYDDKSSLNQLSRWFENEALPALTRYAAAFAYLRLHSGTNISSKAISLAAQAFRTPDWEARRSPNRNLDYLYSELMPFPDVSFLRDSSFQIWLALFKELSDTTIHAHYYGRQLIDKAFSRLPNRKVHHSSNWLNHAFLKHEGIGEGIIYSAGKESPLEAASLTINQEQCLALQTIVDCKPFWEIPTNLFSFFYGLPDNREELRKLIK